MVEAIVEEFTKLAVVVFERGVEVHVVAGYVKGAAVVVTLGGAPEQIPDSPPPPDKSSMICLIDAIVPLIKPRIPNKMMRMFLISDRNGILVDLLKE